MAVAAWAFGLDVVRGLEVDLQDAQRRSRIRHPRRQLDEGPSTHEIRFLVAHFPGEHDGHEALTYRPLLVEQIGRGRRRPVRRRRSGWSP